jgi:hypothetical protein
VKAAAVTALVLGLLPSAAIGEGSGLAAAQAGSGLVDSRTAELASLPAVTLEPSPESRPPYRVGDSIVLRLKDPPAGAKRLEYPAPAKDLAEAGWATSFPERAEVKIVPIKPGTRTLPALVVRGANDVPIARTEPWTVEVASGIAADDPNPAQPAEAPPPVSLPFPWRYAAGAGLLALALLGGIVYGLVRLSRRPAAPLPPVPAAPPKPDHEIALEALASIAKSGFGQGLHKPYHFAISETMKSYLGSRYGFDAPERTSGEIVSRLEELKVGDKLIDRVESLFQRLDRVKFTDHVPDAPAAQAVLQDARQLVLATQRRPAHAAQ